MRSLLVLALCVLGLGLTAETASALEIVLRPGQVDKLARTNLQCANDGVSVKCGTMILTNEGGIAFVPDTLYLSMSENNVGIYADPSGGLGNPPLLPKTLASGPLPPTLNQPQRTPLTLFTPGPFPTGGDWLRPFWEETSDLIIRYNVDASGRPFIFDSKYAYASAHVYPNTDFAILSEIDARFGHYTGLGGQVDDTFQEPHIPLPIQVNPIVTEMVADSLHLQLGLPKPLYSLATRTNALIFKMEASTKWSDGKAICDASKRLSAQVSALARLVASPVYRLSVKAHTRKSLRPVKRDAQQLRGVCK